MLTYVEQIAELDRRLMAAHLELVDHRFELRSRAAAGQSTEAVASRIESIEDRIDMMEDYRELVVAALQRGEDN